MEFMLEKLKRLWNRLNKFQKHIIIIIVWFLNLFVYVFIPDYLYIIKTFLLILSGICGFLTSMIINGDL